MHVSIVGPVSVWIDRLPSGSTPSSESLGFAERCAARACAGPRTGRASSPAPRCAGPHEVGLAWRPLPGGCAAAAWRQRPALALALAA